MRIGILGLSLSSSWGNGHATTYRSLIKGLSALGHSVQFLERDVPWYASNRDLPSPPYCRLDYYRDIGELLACYGQQLRDADAVIIGSYVPDGIQVIDAVRPLAGYLGFYDIDTPVTLAGLRDKHEEYLAARQIPGFDTYFSFSGGPALARLRTEFGARRAVALWAALAAMGEYDNTYLHLVREPR